MQVSFRFVMSFIGFLFVAVTGFFSFFITWHFSTGIIEDVSLLLRNEVVETISTEVIDVTSGVRMQSLRGAIGPLGNCDFGCCSAKSVDAQYLSDFEEVRRFHWENLQTNPNLLLSFSGTMAGSLLLLSSTNNMDDIDGTAARGGRGNLQWTLSDATTNYTYHQYISNSYSDGELVLAQTSLCGAGFVPGSLPYTTRPLASQAECDEAATALFNYAPQSALPLADSSLPYGCQRKENGQVVWNDSGNQDEERLDYQAICRSGYWFRRDSKFEPSCENLSYPCTEGAFFPVSQPGFDASLFSKQSTPYNATVRSWWTGAVANSASCSGAACPGRSEPGWSKVYLSKSTGQLVLPSVFPLYVGSTDVVRSVITLGIGLKFLDGFISQLVQKVSEDATGWIVDLSADASGTLLASFPSGLSTYSMDSELLQAAEASKAGLDGEYIEAVSKLLESQSQNGWLGLLDFDVDDSIYLDYDQNLVQAHRISDGNGLEWLFVLSVPRRVFWGDLAFARDITIVGVCCLTGAMCLVLFALSWVVSKHLMALGRKMADVAEMKMDSLSSDRISMYREVSTMEISFKTMTKKLQAFWSDEQARNRKREETHRRRLRTKVLSAISEADSLRHPMVLCRASSFIEMGALRSYESLRDTGKLVVLDTMEKVISFEKTHAIVFFSHQWLGWGEPDPENVHHQTMVSAIHQLQKMMANPIGEGPLSLEDMYIWVDFGSISQEHRGMQMLAISSLPVYSSVAHAFVVIAPTTTHKHNGEVCDLCSYDERGWCRVETLSKVCASGIDNMYVMDEVDSELTPMTMEMFQQNLSLRVFEGEFSCCSMGHKNQAYCDKEQLVQSVLGLYFKTLSMQDDPSRKVVLQHIEEAKDRFFPAFFKFSLPDGREEERELFGDLVSTMEVVNKEKTSAAALRDTLTPILEEGEVEPITNRLYHASRSSSRNSKDHLSLNMAPAVMDAANRRVQPDSDLHPCV